MRGGPFKTHFCYCITRTALSLRFLIKLNSWKARLNFVRVGTGLLKVYLFKIASIPHCVYQSFRLKPLNVLLFHIFDNSNMLIYFLQVLDTISCIVIFVNIERIFQVCGYGISAEIWQIVPRKNTVWVTLKWETSIAGKTQWQNLVNCG